MARRQTNTWRFTLACKNWRERVGKTERARDNARREASRLSAELEALERQRGGGEDVGKAIVKTEVALTAARLQAGQPWAERVRGGQAAVRDAAAGSQAFANASYAELAEELAEDAAQANARADSVLLAVQDAYHERSVVAARAGSLAWLVGMRDHNLVPKSRLGPLARQAEAVVMSGGEVLPVARRGPAVVAAA